MFVLEDKKVLVLGLEPSGIAAARLLARSGAKTTLIDSRSFPQFDVEGSMLDVRCSDSERANAEHRTSNIEHRTLKSYGVAVKLNAKTLPEGKFDFAVVAPEISLRDPLLLELKQKEVPVISELELGYQQSLCLNIAVTGTNGKTITTQLIQRMLTHCHRKTLLSDESDAPLCSVAAQTRDLDFLTLEVSSFQLEHTKFFRPTIAVLLNAAQDHLDRYDSMAEYIGTKARLFANQQSFDWAIVQSEALARMRSLNLPMPAKVITFSANNRRADIFLDRGLIVSRLDDWAGPLFDMDKCKLRGPHNAEIMMAALAVGRVLRLPLEQTAEALKNYELPPHRCELVSKINGVQFINDSRSTNVGALERALLSIPEGRAGEPNVWLIAGGRDKGCEFHDIGPLLSQRVKGAFLIGEAREKIRAAWSLFTPCTLVDSLLEAVPEAAKFAASGDVILFSPACSSFDQFRSYQHRGEVYRDAVSQWARTTDCGSASGDHNRTERKQEVELSR